MKKGDRIIWDNGKGYEIGHLIKMRKKLNECVCQINGIIRVSFVTLDELHLYTESKVEELSMKYGYLKKFVK